MVLTKLPRLAKKTWAEMASESDDDSETKLLNHIQIAKQTKTVSNPKDKQTVVQQNPTPKSTNSYLSKNKFLTVLQMELEFWDKNPFKATAKAFPQGFHFRPTAINKTRKFYEFILVDIGSLPTTLSTNNTQSSTKVTPKSAIKPAYHTSNTKHQPMKEFSRKEAYRIHPNSGVIC